MNLEAVDVLGETSQQPVPVVGMLDSEPSRRLRGGGLLVSNARIKPTGHTGECWRVSVPSAVQSISPVRDNDDNYHPPPSSIAAIDKLWIELVADVKAHAVVCVHDLEVSPSGVGLAETPQVVVGYASILEIWGSAKRSVHVNGPLAPSPLDRAAEVVVHNVVAYPTVQGEVGRWACGRKGRIRHEVVAEISAASGTLSPTGVTFAG